MQTRDPQKDYTFQDWWDKLPDEAEKFHDANKSNITYYNNNDSKLRNYLMSDIEIRMIRLDKRHIRGNIGMQWGSSTMENIIEHPNPYSYHQWVSLKELHRALRALIHGAIKPAAEREQRKNGWKKIVDDWKFGKRCDPENPENEINSYLPLNQHSCKEYTETITEIAWCVTNVFPWYGSTFEFRFRSFPEMAPFKWLGYMDLEPSPARTSEEPLLVNDLKKLFGIFTYRPKNKPMERDNFPYLSIKERENIRGIEKARLLERIHNSDQPVSTILRYAVDDQVRNIRKNDPYRELSENFWFTGKKGFRYVFQTLGLHRDAVIYTGLPKEEYNKQLQEKLERIICSSTNLVSSMALHDLGGDSTLENIRQFIKDYVDKSVYVPGHGIKFDLLFHPKTLNQPLYKNIMEMLDAWTKVEECKEKKSMGTFFTWKVWEPFSPGVRCVSEHQAYIALSWFVTLNALIDDLSDVKKIYDALSDVDHSEHGHHLQASIHNKNGIYKTLKESPDVHMLLNPMSKFEIDEKEYSSNHAYDPIRKLVDKYNKKLLHATIQTVRSPWIFTFAVDSKWCHIHERYHKTPKSYYMIIMKSNYKVEGKKQEQNTVVYCKCHSCYQSGIKKMSLEDMYFDPADVIQKLPDNSKEEEETSTFKSECINHDFLPQCHITLNQTYLGDILENEDIKKRKFVFIKSRMGSGKTKSLSEFLEKHTNYTSSRVLGLSSRVCFANAASDFYSLKSYAEFSEEKSYHEKNLAHYNRIMISMESLQKLVTPGTRNIIPFDYVLLDESETLLSVFNSSTMNEKRQNFLTLLNILKATKKQVFIMDALMSEKTLGFFQNAGIVTNDPIPNYCVVENISGNSEIRYELLQPSEWDMFLNGMEFDLLQGRHICFVCDSKDILLKVVNHLDLTCQKQNKPINWLTITGDSSDATKQTSVNCNTWASYHLLAYTPAITVGNSCSDPFWTTYGLYCGIVNSFVFLQMMERIRYLISKKRVIFIDSTKTRKDAIIIRTKDDIKDMIRKKDLNIQKEARYLLDEGFTCCDNPYIPLKTPQHALSELFSDNRLQDIKSEINPTEELKSTLKRQKSVFVEMGHNNEYVAFMEFKRTKLDTELIKTEKIREDMLRSKYMNQIRSFGFKNYVDLPTAEIESVIVDHGALTPTQLENLYLFIEYEQTGIRENLFSEELHKRMADPVAGLGQTSKYFLIKSLSDIHCRIDKLTSTLSKRGGEGENSKYVIVDYFNFMGENEKAAKEELDTFFKTEENIKLWQTEAKVVHKKDATLSYKKMLHAILTDCFPFFGMKFIKVPNKMNRTFIDQNVDNQFNRIQATRRTPTREENNIYYLEINKQFNAIIAAFKSQGKKIPDALPSSVQSYYHSDEYPHKKFLISSS